VHSLILALRAAGYTVSVILPHAQRSWIGKAHLVNKTLTPSYFTPGTPHQDDGQTHSRPKSKESTSDDEWVLIDGTPASCVQIGLFHFFKEHGEVDLVISGPNYGRNSTALFALSSGTLGGALEAAGCGKRAIAISYAFVSRSHDHGLIDTASKHATKIVEHLYANWDNDTDLYTINVPLVPGVENNKVMITDMLQNRWTTGSIFTPIAANDEHDTADERELAIREGGEAQDGESNGEYKTGGYKHVHFKFAPKFNDVYMSVEAAPPGNDGWAVVNNMTSVTPLRANFMHTAKPLGELKM
jgi:tubulin--tyrosine ligase